MTQIAHGSLTIVGLNTEAPEVYWHGANVPFIRDIRSDWDALTQKVVLRVSAYDPIHDELALAGIKIKKVY